jgi:hypothetical protein
VPFYFINLWTTVPDSLVVDYSTTAHPFHPLSLPAMPTTVLLPEQSLEPVLWTNTAKMQHGRAATGLLDQLNMFLVAHLKSVPEENLPTKIQETFQLIDIDGSGELNMQEVRTFLYSFSPTPPASPFFSLLPFNAIASATQPISRICCGFSPSLPPSLSLSLSRASWLSPATSVKLPMSII